jgi:glucose/arabinose dehydrogenase/putative cell wall-binding protein
VAARLVVSLLVVALALTAGPRHPAVAAAPVPTTTVVQGGLVVPWDVAFTPDGTMLVTERPGRVRVYASGAPGAALVSTETIPNVRAEHESGANGLAVDVSFATNRFVYVCASRDPDGPTGAAPWVNEVLRYRLTTQRALTERTVIFTGARADFQHNGCSVEMDASGHLWVGIGDGRIPTLAQDPASPNGKILRMNRDGSVPDDNPIMPGAGGRSHVYSMGHRNPQGIAFEPGTGRVYAAEHGPNRDDEINLIQPGANYGWPCYTGVDTPHLVDGCGPASAYAPPAWASGVPTIATSALAFLSHPRWGDWTGSAIVAQLKEQDLRRFVGSNGGQVMTQADLFLDREYGRLRATVQAPDGALYVTTSNGSNDMVLRIVPGSVLVERYAGADRYATAALVSQRTFARGVPVVYVATGTTYPDALTGGAAAARSRGPVLLVTPTTVPTVTRTEIQRLQPQRIIVLGGTSAISTSVQNQLASLAPGGASRLSGADRYETAAAISRSTFGTSVPVAYVATGADYPDALGGVPAAGVEGGPILLVRPSALPSATRTELQRLRPQRIVVLGGTKAVSDLVASQLQSYTASPIQRRAGVDRYETAVAVSRASFGPSVSHVYVATGANFPDGLSGGPAAAAARGPLLLVRDTSLPASVRNELLRLAPQRVTILGGMNAVSESVRAELTRLLNP